MHASSQGSSSPAQTLGARGASAAGVMRKVRLRGQEMPSACARTLAKGAPGLPCPSLPKTLPPQLCLDPRARHPASALTHCVALSKSLNLSEPLSLNL